MTGSSTNNRMARNGIDWGSVAIFFSLMLLGWLNIYAAVFDDAARAGFSLDSRYGSQLIWMGVSVLAAVVIMLMTVGTARVTINFGMGVWVILLYCACSAVDGCMVWIPPLSL